MLLNEMIAIAEYIANALIVTGNREGASELNNLISENKQAINAIKNLTLNEIIGYPFKADERRKKAIAILNKKHEGLDKLTIEALDELKEWIHTENHFEDETAGAGTERELDEDENDCD